MSTVTLHSQSYQAQLHTPVGPVLLCTDGQALTGLYFIDQQDCPNVPGLPALTPSRHKPSHGMHRGQEIRRLRIQPGVSLPLVFDNDDGATDVNPSSQFALEPLAFMQNDMPTPAVDLLQQTRIELQDYFSDALQEFSVPVAMAGSEFQRAVWQALLDIPYGRYVSYGDIARQIGRSTSHARAIGTAVGANPISIIVPCHRVVSGSRAMTGYSGGLTRKLALLKLEGVAIA